MTTAKFRNTVSFLSLTQAGMHNIDVRTNDEGKHCAYFYASKSDLDAHQNILCHCYVTESAVAEMQQHKLETLFLTECSQDGGQTWVPLICVGGGITGLKGQSVLQFAF